MVRNGPGVCFDPPTQQRPLDARGKGTGKQGNRASAPVTAWAPARGALGQTKRPKSGTELDQKCAKDGQQPSACHLEPFWGPDRHSYICKRLGPKTAELDTREWEPAPAARGHGPGVRCGWGRGGYATVQLLKSRINDSPYRSALPQSCSLQSGGWVGGGKGGGNQRTKNGQW